jgi:hypothetical protein
MYSKYIKGLIRDYRKLNYKSFLDKQKMAYKSFLDKHGASAVALAKKMSERQTHEQTIDNQTRGIKWN